MELRNTLKPPSPKKISVLSKFGQIKWLIDDFRLPYTAMNWLHVKMIVQEVIKMFSKVWKA